MSSLRLVKALLVPAAVAAALASPLFGAAPAAAASCQHDPYTKACVSTTNYKAATGGGALAVQRAPSIGKKLRSLPNRSNVGVLCQINNGAKVKGSRTWNAIRGGGWVPNSALKTPAVGTDGYSRGVRHCGASLGSGSTATLTPSAYQPSAYPYPTQNGWVSDEHGYYQGECVSFAAWAVRTDGRTHSKSPDFLGDAKNWTGASVDATPRVGDVAQWDGGYHYAGSYGHVAYVTAVASNGSVTVNEYNWGNFHRFGSRTFAASEPSRYLHY